MDRLALEVRIIGLALVYRLDSSGLAYMPLNMIHAMLSFYEWAALIQYALSLHFKADIVVQDDPPTHPFTHSETTIKLRLPDLSAYLC